MLKHCQATANERSSTRSRRLLNTTNQSSVSLNSSSSSSSVGDSLLTNNNLRKYNVSSSSNSSSHFDSRRSSYSSPESFSRASSFLSLNNPDPRTTPIRVFAKCLRPDIEYKTIGIGYSTTSSDVVKILLSKFKMKHRDPKLFYLSMDIRIGGGISCGDDSSSRRTLVLEDDARPAELKSCHPWGGDCRFILQSRKGGLVRIWDSAIMRESKYKSLLISEKTNVSEIIKILFRCYGVPESTSNDYVLVERCDTRMYERRLHPTDCPALVQSLWPSPSSFRFVLKPVQEEPLSIPPSSTIHEEEEEDMDDEIEDMDVSYSTSSSSSSPVTPKYCRPYPVKRATISKPPRSLGSHVPSSIPPSHPNNTPPPPPPPPSVICSLNSSGLPPPILHPKPDNNLLIKNNHRSSFGSISSSSSVGSQTSFHNYENYFYI